VEMIRRAARGVCNMPNIARAPAIIRTSASSSTKTFVGSHVRRILEPCSSNILWPPFRQAKAALFTELPDRYQPLAVHLLSVPPSPRHAVQTEADKLILSLLEIDRELDNSVKQVRESISRR
jgi:hypothetical protein